MAEVGSIKLNLRLRIEAGLGHVLTDVGHADMEIALPVEVTALAGDSAVGAGVSIDTTTLTSRLSAAAKAFENVAKG